MIQRKMNTVFIPVVNLKDSVDWYAKVLGFEIDPVQYNEIEELPVYTFQMGETSLTLEEEKDSLLLLLMFQSVISKPLK
jgi:catechol 2,3-dioxygenase-like lactoylglutathione lyase family enzyme